MIHANAGNNWNAVARCGQALDAQYPGITPYVEHCATNSPSAVDCPRCLKGQTEYKIPYPAGMAPTKGFVDFRDLEKQS